MISFLFFLSGFTALLYEVVWQRLLHLTFGLSLYAVTTVTASFMLGLALGYLLGQSRRLTRYHPLVVYGVAEGAIGVFALLFPLLLKGIDAVYVAAGGSFIFNVLLSLLALTFPAALMGLTLPTLARYVAQDGPMGRRIGLLYALNTTGAVFGAFFAGAFFIRTYGVLSTIQIATAINAAICLIALTQPRKPIPAPITPEPPSSSLSLSLSSLLSFLVFPFLAGFVGLALEILWVRTLVCVVSNNTYSFAIVLADVLAGLALGAWLYSAFGPSQAASQTKAFVFLLAEVTAAVFVLISLSTFNHLHEIALDLSRRIGGNHWLGLGLVRLGAAAVVTLVPAMVSGFVAPLLIDLFRDRTQQPAQRVASAVFAANTFGSMAGALTGGLVLIPTLGLSHGMVFLALLSITLGLAMFFTSAPTNRVQLTSGCLLASAALLAVFFLPKELTLTKWYDRFENVQGELLFYREGAFGTVAVFQLGDAKELTINCIEEVPTHRDAVSTFKLLGHLPLLLHDNPETVLVNAVGGGVTLGAVTKHDVQVEAVDIVPDVRDAMALFDKENDNVLQRTNWRLIADDGRHYLKISPRRYDVITADATHPAAAESWVLYTQEYYELVKAKLTEKGVFAQWLPLHNMAPADYLAVLRTFRSVFPETLLLFTNRYTLLIGAKAKLPLTSSALDQRLFSLNDTVRSDLKEVGVSNGQDVLKFIIFDGAGLDKLMGEDYPILTDNQTSVEFAELNRLGMAGTMPFILARLLPDIHPDALARQYDLDPKVSLARALFMRSKAIGTDDPLERSFQALREVNQASQLTPDDRDIAYYKQITTLEFLDLLNARYTELLNSSSPQTLLPKAGLAAQLQPQNHFVQELLGVTLLKLKKYDEAVAPLEAAASLKQDDVTYLSNLAFAYDQLGRSTDALRVLRQAKTVKPEAGKFLDEAIKRIEQKTARSN